MAYSYSDTLNWLNLFKFKTGNSGICQNRTFINKFLLFNYKFNNGFCNEKNVNYGDYIQTIATKQAIEKAIGKSCEFEYVDRENVSRISQKYAGYTLIMQGWFSHTLNFVPPSFLRTVWVGTHINPSKYEFLNEVTQEFPSIISEPIGCRDYQTQRFFDRLGIENYFSRCLTLTLDKRCESDERNANKVFLVNFDKKYEAFLPENIRKNAIRLNQRSNNPNADWKKDLEFAENLLLRYKSEAALVITSALHCASPCISMGIPVVLFQNDVNKIRLQALDGIIPIYKYSDLQEGLIRFEKVKSVEIEELKKLLIENLRYRILGAADEYAQFKLKTLTEKIKNFKTEL